MKQGFINFTKKHPVALIFSTALFFRWLWNTLFIFLNYPAGAFTFDSQGYWQLAENLVLHDSFGRFFDRVWYDEFFRTPLYPAFLAFFKILSAPLWIALFTQGLLSALTCVVVYQLALEIGLSKKTAVLAGLMAALDLTSILFCNFVLTESLFTLLITAGLLVFSMGIKRKHSLYFYWCGSLLGLAILCRPAGSFLFVILLLYLAFSNSTRAKKMMHGFLLIGSLLLILSPWLVRNYQLSGRVLISTSIQELFFLCPTAQVYGAIYHQSIAQSRLALWQEMHKELGDSSINNPLLRIDVEKKISLRMIESHPVAFAMDYLKGFIYFAIKPSGAYWDQQTRRQKGSNSKFFENKFQFTKYTNLAKVMTTLQLLELIMKWSLVCLGIWHLWKQKRYRVMVFLTAILVYFALMIPGSSAEGRFRIPALAAISLLGAYGLAHMMQRLSTGKTQDKLDQTS